MGDRIHMDMAQMTQLGANLQSIYDAFNDAASETEGWSSITGESKLSGAIDDFGDKWRLKRQKMLENIKNMQAMVQGIVDTFQEIDSELGKSLEAPGGQLNKGPGSSHAVTE